LSRDSFSVTMASVSHAREGSLSDSTAIYEKAGIPCWLLPSPHVHADFQTFTVALTFLDNALLPVPTSEIQARPPICWSLWVNPLASLGLGAFTCFICKHRKIKGLKTTTSEFLSVPALGMADTIVSTMRRKWSWLLRLPWLSEDPARLAIRAIETISWLRAVRKVYSLHLIDDVQPEDRGHTCTYCHPLLSPAQYLIHKSCSISRALVAHAFNPSYLGGWDQKDQVSEASPGKYFSKTPSPI
jgi:hypothetical protein